MERRQTARHLQRVLLEERIRPAYCFKCKYDLRKSEGEACPECGEVIALPIETLGDEP